jgi:N-acetylmuramoyl-L-alanine amidase
MRGDDVAELQSRLARLGFDCGRVDGIFGPRTGRALFDFQSNCGVRADGVCGPKTVRAIMLVSGQTGDGPGVAAVRDRERLRVGLASVAHCRVVVGQFGGLSGLTRALAGELRQRGATVMSLDEPDGVTQAIAANHFSAHAYIGFEAKAEAAAVAYFYQVPNYESAGGRALAELIVEQLCDAQGLSAIGDMPPTACGRRLPVLRETRMPAVLLHLGPVRAATDAGPTLAASVRQAIELWTLRTG